MTDVEYAAPALDKGLDILELLADEPGGLSQSEIADAVGRSVGQIFRVLATLERRGYLVRDRQSGLYSFSLKVFDLAHRHPPLRGLLAVAASPMRNLSEKIQQSCNLSVRDADRVRVVAQVESPADFGYLVRVGALFDIDSTATGAVLRFGELVVRPDALQTGITDVVAPVRLASTVVAALTVPYIATTFSAVPVDEVVAAALATAEEISRLVAARAEL